MADLSPDFTSSASVQQFFCKLAVSPIFISLRNLLLLIQKKYIDQTKSLIVPQTISLRADLQECYLLNNTF
jgi:hypothetical protein